MNNSFLPHEWEKAFPLWHYYMYQYSIMTWKIYCCFILLNLQPPYKSRSAGDRYAISYLFSSCSSYPPLNINQKRYDYSCGDTIVRKWTAGFEINIFMCLLSFFKCFSLIISKLDIRICKGHDSWCGSTCQSFTFFSAVNLS